MTEEEWRTSQSIWELLEFHNYTRSDWRRIEIFLVACCRRVEEFILSEVGTFCLDEVERHPIGGFTADRVVELRAATASVSRQWAEDAETLREQAIHFAEYAINHLMRYLDLDTLRHCSRAAALRKLMLSEGESAACDWVIEPDPDEEQIQTHLLRCIVGNPFRPVTFDPAWRTEATVGIAAKMYDDRDFAPMPILADALEEAGCDNPDILAHCREPGPHARGCWVVDGVLGKR